MASFVDQVTLHLLAGHGGNGCVSVKREKFKPLGGPDGLGHLRSGSLPRPSGAASAAVPRRSIDGLGHLRSGSAAAPRR